MHLERPAPLLESWNAEHQSCPGERCHYPQPYRSPSYCTIQPTILLWFTGGRRAADRSRGELEARGPDLYLDLRHLGKPASGDWVASSGDWEDFQPSRIHLWVLVRYLVRNRYPQQIVIYTSRFTRSPPSWQACTGVLPRAYAFLKGYAPTAIKPAVNFGTGAVHLIMMQCDCEKGCASTVFARGQDRSCPPGGCMGGWRGSTARPRAPSASSTSWASWAAVGGASTK
jgi:hypothetical protein